MVESMAVVVIPLTQDKHLAGMQRELELSFLLLLG
jgi:hypothetical protein